MQPGHMCVRGVHEVAGMWQQQVHTVFYHQLVVLIA